MNYKLYLLLLIIAGMVLLTACSEANNVIGVPQPHPASDQAVASGRALTVTYGCGSCHTIPGVPGADSMAGPPLVRFYERSYIAGVLPNTQENLEKWIQHPQEVVPGNAMPNLGVTADQARDIAAYL